MRKTTIIHSIALFVGLTICVQLKSQNTDTLLLDKLLGMTLDQLLELQVTTSSKTEQKAWEAPAKIVVIPEAIIQSRGYFDLVDVLKDIPYFQVQSEYGHWMKGAIVNLRGHRSGDSGNNKFLILIDGIKVSDEAEEGLYMGLNTMPLNNVKQIEIAYGPNSTLYGRDAYAGMINIVSKTNDYCTSRYSYGDYKTQRLYAGVSQKLNDHIYGSLHYSTYKSDEQNPINKSITYKERHVFPKHPYTERFYRGSNNTMLDMSLKIHDLSLKYILFDIRASETYGCNPDFYVSEYSTVTAIQNQIISADYNYQITPSLNLSLFYSNKMHELDPQTANLYTDDLNRNGTINFQDSTISLDPLYAYGGRKYYYFRTKANNVGVKTTFSITPKLKNISGVEFGFIQGIPIISEGKGGKPITLESQRSKWEHNFETKGIYTDFTYNITDNLIASLGGRYDINSDYNNTFMPRFAVVTRNKRNVFKFILSQGYLAPSVTQRYFESITTFSWIKVNPDLKSQRNTSFELDWSFLANKTQFTTNVFYNKISDGIIESVQTGDSTNVIIGNDTYYVPILQSMNIGNGYRMGGAIEFNQQLTNFLNLTSNYTYITGEDKVQGEKVKLKQNLTSEHTFNFGVDFHYSKYSLYVGGQWFSERKIKSFHYNTLYADFLDDQGYLNFDPTLIFNLNLRINDIWKGFSLFIHAKNFLNKEFYGQTINANWGDPKILQDMRRIDFGIEYNFNK